MRTNLDQLELQISQSEEKLAQSARHLIIIFFFLKYF